MSRSTPDFDGKIPWGGNFTEKAHLEENGLQNFERMSLFHGTRSCLQFTSTAYQIPQLHLSHLFSGRDHKDRVFFPMGSIVFFLNSLKVNQGD